MARVGEYEAQVAPWAHSRVLADEAFVQRYLREIDADTPAVRHGVACIHHEIHHHLIELIGINEYGREPGNDARVDMDGVSH